MIILEPYQDPLNTRQRPGPNPHIHPLFENWMHHEFQAGVHHGADAVHFRIGNALGRSAGSEDLHGAGRFLDFQLFTLAPVESDE